MSVKHHALSLAAVVCLAAASFMASADEHAYSEGNVVNVASIRTVDGKFDEYVQWLSKNWKPQQEAAKKAGYIVSYQVVSVEARTPNDPDLLLITTYKNWAALDGALAKNDAIIKQFEGTVAAANAHQTARASIRTVLGSETMQVIDLK